MCNQGLLYFFKGWRQTSRLWGIELEIWHCGKRYKASRFCGGGRDLMIERNDFYLSLAPTIDRIIATFGSDKYNFPDRKEIGQLIMRFAENEYRALCEEHRQ